MVAFFTAIYTVLALLATLVTSEASIELPRKYLFDTMDDYSLLGVFDFLDFGDLANIAAFGPRYQELIIDHYMIPKFKLPEKRVRIFLSGRDESTGVSFYPSITSFVAIGRDQTLSTINSFCHLFSHQIIITDMMYPVDNDLMQSVANDVNNFCPNTPMEINLELSELQQPLTFTFENAKYVDLRYPENGLTTDLNVYFPRMEVLKITIAATYTLNRPFPHLRQFSVKENINGAFNLQTFGQQNPQIRRLIIRFDWDIMRLDQVNRIFPNLDELQVDIFQHRTRPGIVGKITKWLTSFRTKPVDFVRFRNVKSFTMDIGHFDKYDDWVRNERLTLQFDQLESFRMITYSSSDVDEKINFLAQYTELSHVDFSSVELSYAQMKRLIGALPNLKAVTFYCRLMGRVDDILRIMTEESKLDVISVTVDETKRRLFLEMNALPGDWHLTKNDALTLTFERNSNHISD